MSDESMWRKELSFGRKENEEPAEPIAEPNSISEAESSETPPSESLWKQELTFRRKIEHGPGEAADVEADQAESEPVAPEPEPAEVVSLAPLWKREVTREPDRPTEPTVEALASSADDSAVDGLAALDDPVLDFMAPADTSAIVEPTFVEPGVEEVLAGSESVAPAESVSAPGWEPVEAAVPSPDPEPIRVPSLIQDWSATPAPPPVQGDPTPPEPFAEPEVEDAPVVHPPVPTADLATEPQAKVPFWKKEISFGGGKKKVQAAPVPRADSRVPSTEGVPFWKKDLSFGGRRKKAEHGPDAGLETPALPAAPSTPNAEKVPFWKKDLSFGGGKKTHKAPKADKQPKTVKAQKADKKPKERRAGKAPRVKTERGGSKGGKRLVGLKIGASQLAAARVSNNGTAELQQVAREPLEPGIVVGGELRDPDALSAALKAFFEKHKLPKRGVRLGIANNRIGVRTFEIGGISDQKQLGNAVRFRAQEALPIPIDEAVLDYQVLGEDVDEEGQPTKRILLVVAYRELIDRYVDACKKAGITLAGIDLEAFALLRALQAPQDGVGSDPNAALVAVSIGHERSTFAVSDGRVCEFTRVLEWGGSALNVALARVLDAAPSEAEDVKHELTLTDSTVPEGLTAEQATACVGALRNAIQTFARELVSSLQYYQNQPGSLGIGEIVLTGGTAHLPGLAGELERLIGVRVRVGDPLARMKVAKKVGDPAQIGSLAVAIGLGIED